MSAKCRTEALVVVSADFPLTSRRPNPAEGPWCLSCCPPPPRLPVVALARPPRLGRAGRRGCRVRGARPPLSPPAPVRHTPGERAAARRHLWARAAAVRLGWSGGWPSPRRLPRGWADRGDPLRLHTLIPSALPGGGEPPPGRLVRPARAWAFLKEKRRMGLFIKHSNSSKNEYA